MENKYVKYTKKSLIDFFMFFVRLRILSGFSEAQMTFVPSMQID